MAAAKSIRTEPRSEAVEGAWRIRTAVCAPSASYEYDRHGNRLDTSHPIHMAGRYFACHVPEAQWIADQEAPGGRVKYGRREYKWRTDARLTQAQIRAAYRLHIDGGLSIRELGRQMWQRFGYSSPQSCANSLSDLFKRAGLRARDRVEATVAASTTHGRGARANKAAYKRWHRSTFGPWPSDRKAAASSGEEPSPRTRSD